MRRNLLKSCLVAIGMVAGTMGAWADDTYTTVYSRSSAFGAENLWSQSDIADWGGNTNLTLSVPSAEGETGHGLGFDIKSTNSYQKEFSTIAANSKIKYVVSWYLGSSTADNGNFSYIQFGDNVRLSLGNYYQMYLNTNGKSSTETSINKKYGNTTYTKQIEIIFNTATKTVEKFVFDGLDLTDKVSNSLEGNFNSVSCGFYARKSISKWTVPCYLTSIEVSECKQAVQNVDYTINYTYNGKIVYSENKTSVVGDVITASTMVRDADNYRYFTEANVNPSMVLTAGDNVLTVPVRAAYTAVLNLTTVVAGQTVDEKNLPLEEADDKTTNWLYTYPIYVKKDNKYYIADKHDVFGETGTFEDGEVIKKTVSYTNADEQVVFYAEAEGAAGTDINRSNGAVGAVGAQNKRNRGIDVGALVPGVYEFSGVITGNNKRSLVVREKIVDVAAGAENESEVNQAIANSTVYATLNNSTNSGEFTLDDKTNLIITGPNSGEAKTNQSEDFDYVVIKLVNAATESVTVSSANYATYVTKYNVAVPADVKVYTVKANEESTGIETTEVAEGTIIPAGTGILVGATEAGDYPLTITNAAAQPLADNDLLPSTGDGVTSDGATCYALGSFNGKVGFALVAQDVVIPAGKAYLKVAKASGAKFISLGGEITAISDIATDAAADNAPYYTIEGIKVQKPVKGLYIHNGKKVVVK